MGKLPQILPKDLVKLFVKEGFIVARQIGSHLRLTHKDGRKITIPMHTHSVPKGTLISILHQANIDKETFEKMLEK